MLKPHQKLQQQLANNANNGDDKNNRSSQHRSNAQQHKTSSPTSATTTPTATPRTSTPTPPTPSTTATPSTAACLRHLLQRDQAETNNQSVFARRPHQHGEAGLLPCSLLRSRLARPVETHAHGTPNTRQTTRAADSRASLMKLCILHCGSIGDACIDAGNDEKQHLYIYIYHISRLEACRESQC